MRVPREGCIRAEDGSRDTSLVFQQKSTPPTRRVRITNYVAETWFSYMIRNSTVRKYTS